MARIVRLHAFLVLSLLSGVLAGEASTGARDHGVSATRGGHLGADSTLRDVWNHPSFAGWSRLLLPWDDRAYDEQMPLSRIGSLLPYHSHVDPETVAGALNRMIDEAAGGQIVFYRFYSEAERQEEPARENTGLLRRPAPPRPARARRPWSSSRPRPAGPSPPGAAREGPRPASPGWGRTRPARREAVATRDLAAAVSYIFQNGATLGVGTNGYSLWGSSAGARMAAAIGSHRVGRHGGGDVPRPSAVVMAYTAHSDHSPAEPPTFVVVGEQDGIAPPAVMKRRLEALRKAGTRVEYHEYAGLGHGFGLGTGTSAEGWVFDPIRFWETALRGPSTAPR